MRRPFDRSPPVIRRQGRSEPKEETMGTLLDFTSAQRPAARVGYRSNQRRMASRETFGEVILFPGVRYERHDLDLAARIATIGKAAGPAGSDKD
jgi:hypothetical protein